MEIKFLRRRIHKNTDNSVKFISIDVEVGGRPATFSLTGEEYESLLGAKRAGQLAELKAMLKIKLRDFLAQEPEPEEHEMTKTVGIAP